MGGLPVPKPSYLDQCISVGVVHGKKRWKSKDLTRIYTWDSLHGEIEVYNKRGKHLGVLNPEGDMIKGPVKGRTIYV